MIPILPATPENVGKAAEALRRGELVAMPTETVYGLAGAAFREDVLARIFEVKRRPFFDPLIVHIGTLEEVESLWRRTPPEAQTLMERFWPGPLTLVLPKREGVPDLATAGLPDVAVRMPAHPTALELCRAAGALAAPSANPFGGLSPTRPEHVTENFDAGIACVLDGGPCKVGVESTVLGWAQGVPHLLRAGGIPLETLQEALGREIEGARPEALSSSPGNLPWHYAPRTPLVLLEPSELPEANPEEGLLWFGAGAPAGFKAMENLSPKGDLREAAARLFAALHRLDGAGLRRILARPVSHTGLGRAINDRLRKAAARR
jgi:L-threonylcarbamoyladenylate synthase